MNKSIKKCLLVYISMATILCGMVGVTYAITATDADQYVTRSQYAVDMAHLQNMLDEKEAGLLGEINRFRSTDIKFTTFDTPDKDVSTVNAHYNGKHTGGNYFPRRNTQASGNNNMFGLYTSQYSRIASNRPNDLVIYRLWNGNYLILPSFAGKESKSNDSSTEYVGHAMCAVPVEDLPGWYFVMGCYKVINYNAYYTSSLVKLDNTIPQPTNAEAVAIKESTHTIRLKKDLWQYCSDYVETTLALTTTPVKYNRATNFGYNYTYAGSLVPSHLSTINFNMSETVTWTGQIDANTGDYILTFSGMRPCSNNYGDVMYNGNGDQWLVCRFLPRDNVEYMMGPTGALIYQSGRHQERARAIPDLLTIGPDDSPYQDGYTYEFVDGVNGIKYWHAQYLPSKTQRRNGLNLGWHYSLPIVY